MNETREAFFEAINWELLEQQRASLVDLIDEITEEARQMAQDDAGQGWGEDRLATLHGLHGLVKAVLKHRESPRDEAGEERA